MKNKFILSLAALSATAFAGNLGGKIALDNVRIGRHQDQLTVAFDYVLDSLKLSSNQQLVVSPVLRGAAGDSVVFPAVLINGRNMQYAYERGTVGRNLRRHYDIVRVVRRMNGTDQMVDYTQSTPFRKWMYSPDTYLTFIYDECGCGWQVGTEVDSIPVELNPVNRMMTAWLSPKVTDTPVSIHEGKARVQFEVGKTDLHSEPFVCRNGQRLDNRAQLAVINDSVRYATSDPNVEIVGIELTGYASPESPYTTNDFLATNRAKSLAAYIAGLNKLPTKAVAYAAVPENWEEFREQVVAARDITEAQRTRLLQLIDREAHSPADYDAKEKELRTDPQLATLYRTKILPEWFPKLRATKFAISTRLKPLPDERLAEVILTNPGQMSLNQMFRVARLYDEDAPEFARTIEIALKYYPDSEEANTNAAIGAIRRGEFEKAGRYLQKAGANAQAENARGILAAKAGDIDEAERHFRAAGKLPEAQHNLSELGINP